MDLDTELTDEMLDRLDEFLVSEQAPDALDLSALDGFLTGLAVGPELILPSEWLPAALGEPQFETEEHAEEILQVVLLRYNEILSWLAEEPAFVDPIFAADENGGETAEGWVAGFLCAAGLRPKKWARLFTDQEFAPALLPLLANDAAAGTDFFPEMSEADLAELRDETLDAIPDAVTLIAAYWRDRQPRHAPKVGRNESCPCGSGRKYKRCCGA